MPIFDILDNVLGFQTGRGRRGQTNSFNATSRPEAVVFQNENGRVVQRESNQSPFLQQVFANLGLDPNAGRVTTSTLEIASNPQGVTSQTQRPVEALVQPLAETAETDNASRTTSEEQRAAQRVSAETSDANSLRARLITLLSELE